MIRKIANNLLRILDGRIAGPSLCHRNDRDISEVKILTAKKLINEIKHNRPYENIQEAEFQAFSQFGDDGIIQYLKFETNIRSEEESFIEFGVQNYRESNTRFLLLNDNWKGLVLDSSQSYIEFIKQEDLYWRHDLTAVAAFINTDNVNALFEKNGFRGDIGLLSIDIDGNDYWVWERVDVVNPAIVIVEYNSLFGSDRAVTVPYDPAFDRSKAHYSYVYWGSSLKALAQLAEKKGYTLVGSNSAGNNAYFVRKDRVGRLKRLEVSKGYVKAKFREARDTSGRLTFAARERALELIRDMPLWDVERNTLVAVKDL